jgi:hypothetical protein
LPFISESWEKPWIAKSKEKGRNRYFIISASGYPSAKLDEYTAKKSLLNQA